MEIGTTALLNDPFQKDCVEEIFITCRRTPFFSSKRFTATVEFENGRTEGKQRFEADTFEGIVKQVDQFIGGL